MTSRFLITIAIVFIVGCSAETDVEVGMGVAVSTAAELEHTNSIPEFNPNKREFTLDDGTPCVMVWTPQTNFPKSGSSGVSCNWEYKSD